MKATQQRLAAILIAGPLCLAACGDDSKPPLFPNSTAPKVINPPDAAPAKTVSEAQVNVGPTGAVAQPVTVGTEFINGGTSSRAAVRPGAQVYDAAGKPITTGVLKLQLDTFNSDPNGGLKQFADSTPVARMGEAIPRNALKLNQIPNQLGAVELRARVINGATVFNVNAIRTEGGGAAVEVTFCSPALFQWSTVKVFRGESSFSQMITQLPVKRSSGATGKQGCVKFELPTSWPGTALRCLVAGSDLVKITGAGA